MRTEPAGLRTRTASAGCVITCVVMHEAPGETSVACTVRSPLPLGDTPSMRTACPPELRFPIATSTTTSRAKSTVGVAPAARPPCSCRQSLYHCPRSLTMRCADSSKPLDVAE